MMTVSTKGRYAARIAVCLARDDSDQPVTKYDIAKQEGISPNYVEQIMIRLKTANLVHSHRGRHGGFSLSRSPGAITLADVLQAVEGPVCPAPCLYKPCERAAQCPTQAVWKRAAQAVEVILQETTIADMAREAAAADRTRAASYTI
jgi:Rrf2 family cysteine metabolism transcriptional repressor